MASAAHQSTLDTPVGSRRREGSGESSRDLPGEPFPLESADEPRRASHRFSAFDPELFSQNQPSQSPTTTKRALEAHLSETERRLRDTSKLGTALVQQRKQLAERIQEVEKQAGEGEISPELRQKLVDIEKEYHDLGRETARSFLPSKSRVVSADETNGNALMEPRRPASPTKFSSQAIDSPSKMNVPIRKQRNQASGRVHDIEFATEISTSLLAQVRQLQAVLAEREESLKVMIFQKSRLEQEALGFTQRLRNLDESEQRYKDENWSLETQTHELMAAAKESTLREQRLQQALAMATGEKTSAQRELDDIKQAHGKLTEDHAAFRKSHDTELSGLKRSIAGADTDRTTLRKRIDELTSQNQELAKAVAGRYRTDHEQPVGDVPSEPEDMALDKSDLEHSPPPSPSKGTARNSMLESETLKSSLHHAHRMIQNLKTTVHREKTEKLELKRMLQESRDELEARRGDGLSNGSKRPKTKSQQDLRKRQGQLGMIRRTEIETDQEWEEHTNGNTPAKSPVPPVPGHHNRKAGDISDAGEIYQTANDDTDAFETANEMDPDAAQTFYNVDSSEDLTETEGVDRSGTKRQSRASVPTKRDSLVSTASTSCDDNDIEAKTPVQNQSQRFRLKLNRGSRRSRGGSEEPLHGQSESIDNSPASFASNRASNGQTLFSELGELNDASDDELEGTPKSGFHARSDSRSTTARSISGHQPGTPTPMANDFPEPPTYGSHKLLPSMPSNDLSVPFSSNATPPLPAGREPLDARPATAMDPKDPAANGVLGSVFGWALKKKRSSPGVAEDSTAGIPPLPNQQTRTSFQEVPANIISKDPKAKHVNMADQASQTMLSATQIDNLLDAHNSIAGPTSASLFRPSLSITGTSEALSSDAPQDGSRLSSRPSIPGRSSKRPGSSASVRSSQLASLPPLPSDHKEAIAAAANQTSTEKSGSMGPPGLPASAYRRPKTPAESLVRPGSRTSMATGARYSTTRSRTSRRSSISSFASDLDERFNIRTDGMPGMPNSGETDPRMIQAITQTMIGEYLWKYTRKAGRGEMSANRHRRFFWIHPYTRTLYWSDQDPSSAGRLQLKAKSVAIDAVQVVADDNNKPLGLHRKSLVILTPGRSIKFTATTGQRHQTWFNALSYLLVRAGGENNPAPDTTTMTTEDVAEFNPTYRNDNAHPATSRRMSLSSYNSRTNTHVSTRDYSPARAQSILVSESNPTLHPTPTLRHSQQQNSSISSRFSHYWRPHRDSISSRVSTRSRDGNVGSDGIYTANRAHGSAEVVRQELTKQEEDAGRLENVRACCDGKHDVGSLGHHHSLLGNRSSRHSHH